MNKKWPLHLFLVIGLIVLATTGLSCRKNEVTATSNSFRDFGITDLLVAEQLLSSSLADATQKAGDWKADAYLVALDIYFDGTMVSAADKPLVYFRSTEDGQKNNFVVTLKTDFSGVLQTEILPIEKSDTLENYEILQHEWTIGYAEALKIAEENKGSFFRSQHPIYGIVVELYKNRYGLEWGVYYSGKNSQGDTDAYSVYISADDGTVKQIK